MTKTTDCAGAPAVLAGLVAFLWVATWLDRAIARPSFDAQHVDGIDVEARPSA